MLTTKRNIYLFCSDPQVKNSVQELIKEVYNNEFYITNDLNTFLTNPFCYILIPTENDLGKSIREHTINIRRHEISNESEFFYPIIIIKNTLSYFNYVRGSYFNIDISELKDKIYYLKYKSFEVYKINEDEIQELKRFEMLCERYFNHYIKIRNDNRITANFFKIYYKYFTEGEKEYFTKNNLIPNNIL